MDDLKFNNTSGSVTAPEVARAPTPKSGVLKSKEPWQYKRVRMAPIVLLEAYLLFTVLLFAFGPWPYPVSNKLALYGFLLAAQLALLLGYRSANGQTPKGSSSFLDLRKVFVVSLVVNILWLKPGLELSLGMGEGGLSFGDLISLIGRGLTNPGELYTERQNALVLAGGSGNLTAYIGILIGPFLWILVPLGVFYWKELSRWMRVGLILYFVGYAVSSIVLAANKGFADALILLTCLWISLNPLVLMRSFRTIARGAAIVVGLLLFTSFFIWGARTRSGGRSVVGCVDADIKITCDEHHPLLLVVPETSKDGVAFLASYFTQGYWALGMALEEPFTWSYGLGNSIFLSGLTGRFLGMYTISDMTYPSQLEKDYGYGRLARWHSFYTWIASDVSFPGTLAVVFIIGRLLALSWIDVLGKQNRLAITVFILLVLMVLYFPANNQVLGFPTTCVSFFTLIPLWLIARKRDMRRSEFHGIHAKRRELLSRKFA
jgi:hypothetical protein